LVIGVAEFINIFGSVDGLGIDLGEGLGILLSKVVAHLAAVINGASVGRPDAICQGVGLAAVVGLVIVQVLIDGGAGNLAFDDGRGQGRGGIA